MHTHLLATGEGCATKTSMPWCLTSGAKLAPKADMKHLVAAYTAPKGEGIQAAADEVKTIQPFSFLSICAAQVLLVFANGNTRQAQIQPYHVECLPVAYRSGKQ